MIQSYFEVVASSRFDWIILGLGTLLLIAQGFGLFMRWWQKDVRFVQHLDRYQTACLQLTELLPLLGIIGTVVGLLNTFSTFAVAEGGGGPDLGQVVSSFAPALSTTLSGLLMAVLNLMLNVFLRLSVPAMRREVNHDA